MTRDEYQILTDTWDGPTEGEDFLEIAGECAAKGWLTGFNKWQEPMLTTEGQQEVFRYEEKIDQDLQYSVI